MDPAYGHPLSERKNAATKHGKKHGRKTTQLICKRFSPQRILLAERL